ncbi:hypothetical protein [Acidithiobacillus sulfurivorans]|nr:hypothetical protein [Acidithiobacillus sulfurivorans]MBU2761075.1 hypothetical protein [Acidithiobacillus sulfurivorans]
MLFPCRMSGGIDALPFPLFPHRGGHRRLEVAELEVCRYQTRYSVTPRGGRLMANIQHIAERVFRHVDASHLPVGYALAMGSLIDAYDDDPDFHEWADSVDGNVVQKLIDCMVREGAWNDPAWLQAFIREASRESAA